MEQTMTDAIVRRAERIQKCGCFRNPFGYEMRKYKTVPYLGIFRKTLWEFRLDPVAPLTFVHPDGRQFQPDQHFITDQGSTPQVLQLCLPKDQFLLSYLFHDSAYEHGGHYVREDKPGAPFLFVPMDRAEVDALLALMIQAEGGWAIKARTVWMGVRLGAWLHLARYGKKRG